MLTINEIGKLSVEEKINILRNQARSELHNIFAASLGITDSVKTAYPNIPESAELQFEEDSRKIIAAIGRLKSIKNAIAALEREL